MKFLRGAAVALFSLFVATAAPAQDAGPPAWLGGLDLTEAQQDKVFGIFHAVAPLIRDRLQAARHAHEDLETLAIAVHLDSDEARAAFHAEAQALAEVAEIRLHAIAAVYQILTEEQRARAVNLNE